MIFVLTGPVHSGKTTFLKKLVTRLKEKRLLLSGYLSEQVVMGQEIDGYDLIELTSGKRQAFLRKSGFQDELLSAGAFYFLPEGLRTAAGIIRSGVEAELLIVDEVGPAEISEKGIWPELSEVSKRVNCLLVVRDRLLPDFISLIKTEPEEIFRPGQTEQAEKVALKIMRVMRSKKSGG
jgi:nucleoside-triphosphatase THEP1